MLIIAATALSATYHRLTQPSFDADLDLRVRLAAFQWLQAQIDVRGDVLRGELLAEGFEFQGSRIPLLNPQGIFKPRILAIPRAEIRREYVTSTVRRRLHQQAFRARVLEAYRT